MFSNLFHALLFAQAAATPMPLEQVRLNACLDNARTDPASGITAASEWLNGVGAPESSYPHQCLGYAYTLLLRWDAAEREFLAAREAELADNHLRRAQLATMAGNAALADKRGDAALISLALAASDAAASQDAAIQAVVETDRARAFVMQGELPQAEAALASARSSDAQAPLTWLLSATLARRLGKLDEAQAFIETAGVLAPEDAEVGLEAGVIAMLQGREDAATASWQSVIALDPEGLPANIARSYLSQIGETASEPAADADEANEP